jgi:hypothetical protein
MKRTTKVLCSVAKLTEATINSTARLSVAHPAQKQTKQYFCLRPQLRSWSVS